MNSGAETARRLKRNVFGVYLKALRRLDPEVADHILESNRQFFLAGKAFFEVEVGHVERAAAKMRAARPSGNPTPEDPA